MSVIKKIANEVINSHQLKLQYYKDNDISYGNRDDLIDKSLVEDMVSNWTDEIELAVASVVEDNGFTIDNEEETSNYV